MELTVTLKGDFLALPNEKDGWAYKKVKEDGVKIVFDEHDKQTGGLFINERQLKNILNLIKKQKKEKANGRKKDKEKSKK